jgi:AcrR family transcriptional regulator
MSDVNEPSVSPRKKAQQARSKTRVDHILATTLEMLSQGSADKLTTNAIAKQADVSIGTLYQFFPNKEAIFYELFKRWLAQTLDALDIAAQSLEPGASREQCVDAILQALAGAPGINSRGHWQLRLAMSSSKQLAELEAQHLDQVIQRILLMQQRFLKAPPPEQRGDLAMLQNQITIVCLHVLALTDGSDNSANVWKWCRKILMLTLDYEELNT